MITPELIAYMRGELAKGKTRDEIHTALVSGGGWTEADLNEAFRTVIPMQTTVSPAPAAPVAKTAVSSTTATSSPYKVFSKGVWTFTLCLLILVWAGLMYFIYKPQINNLWKRAASQTQTTVVQPTTVPTISPVAENNSNMAVTPAVSVVKNCGTTTAPDSTKPTSYTNNSILTCLGDSALVCARATAVLTSPVFPTMVEISQNQNACDFTLSYPSDSALVSQTGDKMAGQYITCPLSAMQNPDVNDSALYGSEIYNYGTTGVFLQNNLDKTKISALGCSGPFIDSMIASYNAAQTKK